MLKYQQTISKYVQEILKNHILPFNWNGKTVWALDSPVIRVPRGEYDYLLTTFLLPLDLGLQKINFKK